MSGFEVLGVVASASQLIRYTCEIIDYTRSVFAYMKGKSCQFQQHREHLEALVSAVEVIRQTPLLQTRLIRDHLAVLLGRTEILRTALRLYTTVDPPQKLFRVFWTALRAPTVAGQILKDLAILERDKSNLLLCITSSYGIVLHEIREKTNSGLVAVKDNMDPNGHRKAKDFPPVKKSNDRESGQTPDGRRGTPKNQQAPASTVNSNNRESGQTLDGRRGIPKNQQASASTVTTRQVSGTTQTTTTSIQSSGSSTLGNVYHHNEAQNGGLTLNRANDSGNQGQKHDFFVGNSATDKGSAVLNGPMGREHMETMTKRNSS